MDFEKMDFSYVDFSIFEIFFRTFFGKIWSSMKGNCYSANVARNGEDHTWTGFIAKKDQK